ncbi:replication protein A 70 kDa DNA-binding subunit B-like [Silene latifolia]|uniref:replication protein A 70 kDa DNA-binding subunit B-like n=1 Tax=Silene latifolia TaxID=37657 RepID=UPI003D774E9C
MPDGNPYQLSFGADTIIRPVEGSTPQTGPNYITITAIPRAVSPDDRYDVVVILIFMEPLRQLERHDGQGLDVRELVVIDQSTSQPLIITAWAELATIDGEKLHVIAGSFPIIGLTSLKPSYHKGFSLSTTYSTYVKLEPDGDAVDRLRAWYEANKQTVSIKQLYSRNKQVVAARTPGIARLKTTIKKLRLKKPMWGKHQKDSGDVYNCGVCKRQSVTSVPRMNISFEAIDDTGSFTFTSFTNDSEKLLATKTNELYKMEPEGQQTYLQKAETRIRAASIYIQVGPAKSLSTNGALKWVLILQLQLRAKLYDLDFVISMVTKPFVI